MTLLVVVPDRNNDKLMMKLQQLLPQYNVVLWREGIDCSEVTFVLAWNAPSYLWPQLPKLLAISSYGAGVDSLLKQSLPDVPIARIVDPQLADNMSDYVLHAIGYFKLRFSQYQQHKTAAIWKPRRAKTGTHVGILGLGNLGQAVAKKLSSVGFSVSGWSRSEKNIEGVCCYAGAETLHKMVSDVDYLVCLLPLTPQTRGILNQTLFQKMPIGSVIVNVARGEHLNETDLLAALDDGQLSGAALDVFTTEPLPTEHLFWQQPNILLTPHISAVTNIDSACGQIADNYLRIKLGKTLCNQIDQSLGY
ncbi:MAG: glyoxylate/hydroxypyruvate reductase A [Psychrobium sp.]|nr:glyoxylate/hydroxypyruvate reductase A [Psychrobium sp.]